MSVIYHHCVCGCDFEVAPANAVIDAFNFGVQLYACPYCGVVQKLIQARLTQKK